MRFFALTMPGLGPLLRDELTGQLGPAAVGDVENDGRSDVVPFSAGPVEAVETALAEDLFVELGTGDPAAPLRRLVGQLWSAERYDAALPATAPRLGRLGPRPGFRVVARVRSERGFLRTDLRDHPEAGPCCASGPGGGPPTRRRWSCGPSRRGPAGSGSACA